MISNYNNWNNVLVVSFEHSHYFEKSFSSFFVIKKNIKKIAMLC